MLASPLLGAGVVGCNFGYLFIPVYDIEQPRFGPSELKQLCFGEICGSLGYLPSLPAKKLASIGKRATCRVSNLPAEIHFFECLRPLFSKRHAAASQSILSYAFPNSQWTNFFTFMPLL